MPEIPTVDSPQTTAVQTVDQKPSTNSFLVILLSVLLLLSVIIAGFFAYQTQKLVKELTMLKTEPIPTPEVTMEPTTEPVATDSSEVDPTANWKTYTNEKFVFKYPSTVTVSLKTQGQEEIIGIKGLMKDVSLVVDPIEDHNFYLGKQILKTIKYNNVSWNLLTGSQQYCDGGECGNISDALQVEYQNKRYSIVLGDLIYPDTVLNQILSTFKFTN